MKLLYLLTTADGRAGTEKTFADQSAAMSELGYDVTVASVYRFAERAFDYGERVRVDYLTSLEGPTSNLSLLIPVEWDNQFCAETDMALTDYLRNTDADIVIASTPALAIFALFATPAHVKVVDEEHRPSMSRGITAVPLLTHGPKLDAVVSLVERNSGWLAEQWGDAAPRLFTIPNALPATGRPRSSLTQKIIMGAGRFARNKGFHSVIDAFAQVASDFPEWRLRIFGDGDQKTALLTQARNLGLSDRIEFLAPTAAIEEEWARASIGVLASTYEGLPLVLIEAAGAGLPLVSFDCTTGPREIISNGETGFLLDVGDVQGFADALRLLMEDENLRLSMGEASLASVARFEPSRVAAQWDRLFQEIGSLPKSARERALERGQETSTAAVPVEPDFKKVIAEHGCVQVAQSMLTESAARQANRVFLQELFQPISLRARSLALSATRSMWAVPIDRKDLFLKHIIGNPEACSALEVRLYAGRVRLDRDGFSWRNDKTEVDFTRVTRAFLFQHYNSEAGDRGIGYAAGINVEFSREHPRRAGLYWVEQRNQQYDTLLPSQFNSQIFANSDESSGVIGPFDVPFPIDAVYTWVDGNDPNWRRKKACAVGENIADNDLASGDMRFLNRDELRYSLRSLQAHAPWLRKIFIVTDQQIPSWMAQDDRLEVVSHDDIFPDPSVLPVFNSHAIEACLHRIPNLSEHFLYLNDDIFLMRLQSPEDYFTPSGQPKMFFSPTKINDLHESAEPHERAAMNNRRLLETEFGRTIYQSFLHTPHALRKSRLEELEERYPEVFTVTRSSKFRAATDYSIVSSLVHYFDLFEGAGVVGSRAVRYVGLGGADTAMNLNRVASAQIDVLSFGEAPEDVDPENTQYLALSFMENKFPVPTYWEKDR